MGALREFSRIALFIRDPNKDSNLCQRRVPICCVWVPAIVVLKLSGLGNCSFTSDQWSGIHVAQLESPNLCDCAIQFNKYVGVSD